MKYANDLSILNDVIAENIAPLIGHIFTRDELEIHDVNVAEMLLVVFPVVRYRWLKMVAGTRKDMLNDKDLMHTIRREFCLEMINRLQENKESENDDSDISEA